MHLLRFATLFAGTCVLASAAEFRGRLDPQVEMGTRALVPVAPASPEIVAALPAAPGAEDKVWMPSRPITIKGKTFRAALVATTAGEKTLWFDRDGDGKFSPDERFPIPAGSKDVSLDFPWDNGIYRAFPIRFEYSTEPVRRAAGAAAPADVAVTPTTVTSLIYNFNVLFTGSAEIDGKPMKVVFGPKPNDVAIDPASQRTSMDTNFNGEIEPQLGEAENGSGKIPVFRAGAHFLAVKIADVKTGELVLEERPASDYTRFEALPGQQMPDFAFVDFEGGHHKLSDYRGKFVLLDFWGTWCGPCIEEMVHFDPLYAKYHDRGFEIIGMDMQQTAGHLSAATYASATETARAFIAKAGHKWVQATQESIERVALDVVHVNLYPTCILLDRDGKVVSREARSETLGTFLAKQFP